MSETWIKTSDRLPAEGTKVEWIGELQWVYRGRKGPPGVWFCLDGTPHYHPYRHPEEWREIQ